MKTTVLAFFAGVILLASGCSKKDAAPIKPQVNFTYIVMDPIPPARVEFSNHAVNATTYSWDFGDKTTSTDKDPQHFYTKAGTYVVTLRATGDNGTEQKQYQLTVGAKEVLIRGIRVSQVVGVPDTALFSAVVNYDGGGYRLPGYQYMAVPGVSQPLAVWGGERFYGVPVEETVTINLFYQGPGREKIIPVGEDINGTFTFKPSELTVGANAHPSEITLENGSGPVKNKIVLRLAWL